jgi:leader peptidase (prepilin peptidase)/N-methyltransferase
VDSLASEYSTLLSSSASSPAAIVAAAVLGAMWGSFFNVCIARIPQGLSVVRPGSRCMACGVPVRPWDNIPILSYFLLRGRCRACGARFSIRYALVELLTALLAAAIYWRFVAADPGGVLAIRLARFALYFAFTGALIVLSFIDLDTQLLPDRITIPAIPILIMGGFGTGDVTLLERVIGAAAGFVFVVIISEAYYRLRGREGMGWGDGKLLAMIGALFGWKALPLVLFLASFLGSLISLPLLILARRRQPADATPDSEESLRHAQVPFGPFLALGALIYLFVGPQILNLFLGQLS